MLKKYKNLVAQTLKTTEIPLNKLSIKTENEDFGPTTYIKLNDHPLFFGIIQKKDNFDQFRYNYIKFAPGFPTDSTSIFMHFTYVIQKLEEWIKYDLREYLAEQESPDLLQSLLTPNESFSMNSINFDSLEKFTSEEKLVLKVGLEEIKTLLEESLQLTRAQFAILNSRIDYLEEACERLSKRDWKGILISTVFSIITTLTLDTEKGKLVYNLFSKILDNLPQLK